MTILKLEFYSGRESKREKNKSILFNTRTRMVEKGNYLSNLREVI